MQKQHKTQNPVGRKRQRKISVPGGASESKTIKLDTSDTLTSTKLSGPLLKKSFSTNIGISKNTDTVTETVPSTLSKPIKTKAKIVNAKANTLSNDQAESKKVASSATLKSKTPGAVLASPKKKKKSKLLSDVKVGLLQTLTNEEEVPKVEKVKESPKKTPGDKLVNEHMSSEDVEKKYPILKDKVLRERSLKVPMSNNQKGRIRQAIKLSLQDTSNTMFPDIINGKIQAIMNSSVDLTDSDLRRIRILYNMLKVAVEAPEQLMEEGKPPKKKKDKKKNDKIKEAGDNKDETKQQAVKKTKGPKRYVVFLGNLPLDINKEKIMDHFRELNEQIKDIRLPKLTEGTKSAIAFVELSNEPSYELALSKHHSMLGNKRIKVLYTTQQNTKISKSEAKGKSAKLIALQKAGKLVGSTPAVKKRSHRRSIMKKAKAKEAAVNNTDS